MLKTSLYADFLLAEESLLVYRKGANGVWRLRMDIDQAAPVIAYPPPPEAKQDG